MCPEVTAMSAEVAAIVGEATARRGVRPISGEGMYVRCRLGAPRNRVARLACAGDRDRLGAFDAVRPACSYRAESIRCR